MVSPGKLQLLSTLNEGSIGRFEPTISNNGHVEYTEAKDLLNYRDGTSREALNTLAEKGLLNQNYTSKVYVCPSCHNEGMQYITACPSCEATHTVRASFFEHTECGYTGEAQEFETKNDTDGYICPNCEEKFDRSKLDIKQKNLCKDCNQYFEDLNHRLWCLDCLHFCAPEKATEQTLYEYELSEEGENWYEVQMTAKELLIDEFDTRGFDTRIDASIQNNRDESYSVHIHAKDDLLNEQIIADIHSTIDSNELEFISTAAEEIDARPIVLMTNGSVPSDVLQSANDNNITVLWINSEGAIRRCESLDDEHHSSPSVIDKLSSSIGFTS